MLDSTTAVDFGSYLKKLDFLQINSGSRGGASAQLFLWKLLRAVCGHDIRCSLALDFGHPEVYRQTISFDRSSEKLDIHSDWSVKTVWTQDGRIMSIF